MRWPLLDRLWRLPYLLLTLTALFWSGNFVVGRAVNEAVPPIGLAFWRWAIASLIILPFAWPHLVRAWPEIRRHWAVILLLSIFGVSCFNTMVYVALTTTTALNATVVNSSMPVLIVLFSWLFFRDGVGLRGGLGILMSLIGVLTLISKGTLAILLGLSFGAGDLWVVAAAASYAIYSACFRLRPAIHPLAFVAASFLIGDFFLLPFYGWEIASGSVMHLNTVTVASVLYVAIFPSLLAYLFWNRGIELVGANRTGLFIHLMPVFAGLLAILLLGETLHAYHVIGMALVLFGVWLTATGRRKAKTPRA
ncbi:DMT family transporter [Oceanibacterium hippocampi]|uniref:Putative inner membrane transporter YicL n=1 Tax=Oceanibacterium hippocampi TaxID=745714 RepID=A0A1Y5RQB7_9PROT|nr:DMT family transporter [Oceanibacterium hippocampi]SLN21938.1 putative inner membrane transporter YicL [Oceanibacterium hippocampi]